MDRRQFDEELKMLFQMTGDDVEPSNHLYDNILRGIKQKEEKNMKNIFSSKKIKGLMIAGAICVVSISCYAASKVYSITSHSNKDFTEPPTISQMEKAVDFSVKYVEKFANGFVYENGGSGAAQGKDENGQELVSYKNLNFVYKNPDLPDTFVSLEARKAMEGDLIERLKGEDLNLGDITGQYSESNYKFYPPNVEVSAEDLKLQEEGKLEISYGSSEIEEIFFQTIEWEQDGIIYIIMGSNVKMDKTELADMAKEIIAVK